MPDEFHNYVPQITKLAGSLGARVDGLDLSLPLDETMMDYLRAAFLEHCVLIYPKQNLTPHQQAAFSARWGELHMMPYAPRLDGHPAVLMVEHDPEHPRAGADMWHSDMSCDDAPPAVSFLLANTIPPAGGDTMFANQYLAYDMLSPGMQRMLDGMRAVHAREVFNKRAGLDPASGPRNAHPVVRTHPETKRRALYVNLAFTTHFEDMSPEESQPLLNWLFAHCSQPNLTFRHRWSEGDLVMWDNRCVQHFAIYDYRERRVMHRNTIMGDDPS